MQPHNNPEYLQQMHREVQRMQVEMLYLLYILVTEKYQ
jgi:hypothetical protein